MAVLSACGGGSSSVVRVASIQPGVSPFISLVNFTGSGFTQLQTVEFNIEPKPGSVSKAVDVSYSMSNLAGRGYLTDDKLTVPLFGLYAAYANQISLHLHYQTGYEQTFAVSIKTAAYVDPLSEVGQIAYSKPTIVKGRERGSSLGFDFFFMKSSVESPVILDTDGEIRWAVPGIANAMSSSYQNGEFVIGDEATPTVHRLQLDGTITESPLQSATYTMFHHNIDQGKVGLLAEVNEEEDSVSNLESTVVEITDIGAVLNQWDLAAILSAYMQGQGDNAAAFVRPGVDWFHNNSTTYDPSDDSVIISSRENFVMKIDYHSGNVIWILGDPTKYWYTFPSLRAKALSLNAGGLYPIGQHALSITSGGLVMLFNDGLGSENQPAGTPAGESRTYSAVSAYSIDEASMTAQNVWNFDYGQTLYSSICSSAYESAGQSILVDYAAADDLTIARLVGLDSARNVAFDFQYPTVACSTSWNAVPIALDSLAIQ